jgi:hypothetical protein
VLETFTQSTFSAHLNETFRIHYGAPTPLEVKLIEATSLGSGTAESQGAGKREPFSIVFRGPANHLLPQQTYPIEHNTIGKFELFLVPIGPDEIGTRYEAVFS